VALKHEGVLKVRKKWSIG